MMVAFLINNEHKERKMINYRKILVLSLSLLFISCKEIHAIPDTANANKDICTEQEISTSVEVPMPITLTDKMRKKSQGVIMTNNLLRNKLNKYNFDTLFDGDQINNEKVTFDGFGSLYYDSKTSQNFVVFRMTQGFSLQYFDYIFENHKVLPNQKLLSETDKQEIMTLISIITDDLVKSEQILFNLERTYQQKIDKKYFLTQNTIVANVESHGRLFELRGVYSVKSKNIECHESRLTSFSVT